jgi:hypothetical protein
MHTGEIHDDGNGYFGEVLDIAFRLLDALDVKQALKAAQGPLLLVVSGEIHRAVARRNLNGTSDGFHRLVTAQVAGRKHQGWIHMPVQPRRNKIAAIPALTCDAVAST